VATVSADAFDLTRKHW